MLTLGLSFPKKKPLNFLSKVFLLKSEPEIRLNEFLFLIP
jgi:hypothetical protein